MWIKSLDTDVWVNMVHITNFSIVDTRFYADDNPDRASHTDRSFHEVYAWLDASSKIFTPLDRSLNLKEQAWIIVYQGTHEECEQFIKDQIGLQAAWQWIGYLVAGGVGAVLTLLFS